MFGTTAGPEFLHIQYQGTGDKVLDHKAATLSRLEAVQDASPELLGFFSLMQPTSPTAPNSAPCSPTRNFLFLV